MKQIAVSAKDKTNEKAARRDKNVAKDPQGIEVVKALHGAVQVDKYGDKQAAVLRDRVPRHQEYPMSSGAHHLN